MAEQGPPTGLATDDCGVGIALVEHVFECKGCDPQRKRLASRVEDLDAAASKNGSVPFWAQVASIQRANCGKNRQSPFCPFCQIFW